MQGEVATMTIGRFCNVVCLFYNKTAATRLGSGCFCDFISLQTHSFMAFSQQKKIVDPPVFGCEQ